MQGVVGISGDNCNLIREKVTKMRACSHSVRTGKNQLLRMRDQEGIEALGKVNCLICLLKSLTHIQLLVNNNTIKNSKYGILYFVKLHA